MKTGYAMMKCGEEQTLLFRLQSLRKTRVFARYERKTHELREGAKRILEWKHQARRKRGHTPLTWTAYTNKEDENNILGKDRKMSPS